MRASRKFVLMPASNRQPKRADTLILDAVASWVQRRAEFPDGMKREQLAGGGPIAAFEALLRESTGAPHCLAVDNATNGLRAMVLALDLHGAEIVAPPQSWGGTYAPFEDLGCKLILAESDSRGNICPSSIARLITSSTRAVLTADYHGHPHQMFAVRRICDEHHLFYLADAASSFGRMLRGRPASSLADAWVYSFGPGKPLDLGEGGAILTRDAALHERLVALTQHPARYRREYSLSDANDRQVTNCRIHPLAALMGEVCLQQLKAKMSDGSPRLDA